MMKQLLSLNTACVAPLDTGRGTVMSGIRKTPRDEAVEVLPLGLSGDEQADLSVHGGLSRALYAYPVEHYPFWRTVRAQARVAGWDALLPWGSMGENLSLQGLKEDEVWVGDCLRFPDCELIVTEPRLPCDKFNAVMGFAQAAKLMVQSRWCGFYLAVRTPGTLRAGQGFELLPGARELGLVELFESRTGRR